MNDLDALLKVLSSKEGQKLSSTRLQACLDWAESRYEAARQSAEKHGYAIRGPGGGGGVISLTALGSDLVEFISVLKETFSGHSGNISLRRELQWNEARYLAVRAHSLDVGRIVRARGRGGSIRFVSEEEALEEHLSLFVETLKDNFDGYAGNIALRNELEWNADRYWMVRDLALSRDLIVRGRGKGGTVWLLQEEEEEPRAPERELYEPALKTIIGSWIEQSSYDDHIAKITAHRGRIWTGGTWTRPDISVLAITSYRYPPRRVLEIITFEIKPRDRISIDGVFEALSHKQFAHRSYVLYNMIDPDDNEGWNLENHPEGTRILQTARKYGIGVVVASDIQDWETWNIILEPEYSPPDPEQADLFISTCFEEKEHQVVGEWFA